MPSLGWRCSFLHDVLKGAQASSSLLVPVKLTTCRPLGVLGLGEGPTKVDFCTHMNPQHGFMSVSKIPETSPITNLATFVTSRC